MRPYLPTRFICLTTVFFATVFSAALFGATPFSARTAKAEDIHPFVAFGASATDREVVAVTFSSSNGELKAEITQREQLGMEAAPVLYHKGHRQLYIASLRPQKGQGNKFIAFHVAADGKLQKKREFPLAHGAAYLSFDHTGKNLLCASYFTGNVDVYRVGDNGNLSESVCNVFEQRDKAHAIRTSNDNRFAYVPYVKDQNGLFQYSFDAKSGQLKALDPPQAKVGDGTGPRHIAYHPQKPFVYFSNEQHIGASVFRIGQDGQLELIQDCHAGELRAKAKNSASDIEITPDGKFIFVGVRDFADGTNDSIHRYKINPNGTLQHLGHVEADAIPWGLQVSPSGHYLLVTASNGNTLTAYKISSAGGLRRAASIEWGKTIRDIAVVPISLPTAK